ncbi:hypothetical protein D3C87_1780310 [compost metagenome]
MVFQVVFKSNSIISENSLAFGKRYAVRIIRIADLPVLELACIFQGKCIKNIFVLGAECVVIIGCGFAAQRDGFW